jgi:universal stress protein E
MRPIRRILAAIKNPRARRFPGLAKAAQLARGFDADLEIFHAIDQALRIDARQLGELDLKRSERLEQARRRAELEELAAPLRESGLRVTTAADWDFPAYQAVVRRAARIGADLVVAERHATRRIAPWLLRFNDWELLRLAPVPVLLVKNTREYHRPVILAAVDPSQSFGKPAKLDVEILRTADAIRKSLNGSVHVVHAYGPSLFGMSQRDLRASNAAEVIERKSQRRAREDLGRLMRKAAVRPADLHVLGHQARDAIVAVARGTGSALVVMGALSRSGLKRLLIGNTAEWVADELPCDLLIVKPPGFRSRVARARGGPRLISLSRPSKRKQPRVSAATQGR